MLASGCGRARPVLGDGRLPLPDHRTWRFRRRLSPRSRPSGFPRRGPVRGCSRSARTQLPQRPGGAWVRRAASVDLRAAWRAPGRPLGPPGPAPPDGPAADRGRRAVVPRRRRACRLRCPLVVLDSARPMVPACGATWRARPWRPVHAVRPWRHPAPVRRPVPSRPRVAIGPAAGTPGIRPAISRAPLGGAPLGGAPSGGAPLGGAPFGGAPFVGAPFVGAPLGGAPLGGAPIGGAPWVGGLCGPPPRGPSA